VPLERALATSEHLHTRETIISSIEQLYDYVLHHRTDTGPVFFEQMFGEMPKAG